MALVKEDVPPLATSGLTDPPEYNPLMSNRELRGGSARSTGLSAYKLEVERPNTEGLKDGPTAGYIGVLASTYRRPAEDPL